MCDFKPYSFTPDELARMAEKKNARLRARYPLLAHAGLLETATADRVRAAWDAINARRQAAETLFFERACAFCEAAFQRLGADETALLYRYRMRLLPKAIVDDADFWRCVLRRLDDGSYAEWKEKQKVVFEKL